MKFTQKIALTLLIICTFFLRFYKVAEIPNGLYHDEVDAAYQARSLIETGKDYRGTLSPFFINSYVDPRTPIPVWITAFSTLLFKSPELQTRMGGVIVGSLNVLLIFFLVRLWSKSFWKAFITSFVFATNPWQIQFSRFNHEANAILLLILLSLISFTSAINSKKTIYLYLFSIFLGLSLFTYRTMSLFAPIILITVSFIFRKKLIEFDRKKLLISLILFLLFALPFLYFTTAGSKDKPRIAQIALFSDPAVPIAIQRNRELDSGDASDFSIGKQAIFSSFVFHNKLVSFFTGFSQNYFEAFSVDFLFIKGDKNHRHSIQDQGMLLYIDIIALGAGLYYLFKNIRDQKNKLILFLLFLSPIPSSLTMDGAAHGARLFIFSTPLLIVIGYGYLFLIQLLRKKLIGKITLGVISFIWVVLFSFYLHSYFIHYKLDSARWFSYGYKQAVETIKAKQNEYEKIVLVPTKDPPILFYLFWHNIPPSQVQAFGSEFSDSKIKNMPLDRIKVEGLPQSDIPSLIQVLKPDTLYLVTQQELPLDLRSKKPPSEIKLVDIITYPDKQVAFYLISRAK